MIYLYKFYINDECSLTVAFHNKWKFFIYINKKNIKKVLPKVIVVVYQGDKVAVRKWKVQINCEQNICIVYYKFKLCKKYENINLFCVVSIHKM